MQSIFLFLTAILAGALNSVAGGGSFFTFPALIFTGMNPIIANATSTIAIWPGSVASVFAYKDEIAANKQRLPSLMLTSLIGSIIGAFVLIKTPETTFLNIIPYLLLLATTLFAFSGTITKHLKELRSVHMGAKGAFILQTVIALYGGYFGGGMGIMMLAMLSFMGLTQIHEMNALKTVLGSVINGVAVLIFIMAGIIAWHQAVIMIVGSVIGGYFGAIYAKKVDAAKVKKFVIFVGLTMTTYFFIR